MSDKSTMPQVPPIHVDTKEMDVGGAGLLLAALGVGIAIGSFATVKAMNGDPSLTTAGISLSLKPSAPAEKPDKE